MYAVGIDVSKNKSTIAINYNGELFIKPFEIEHTEEGISKLLEKLQNINKEKIKIVMESTGIFHFPILTKLLQLEYFVYVEKAFLIKNILMLI